MNNFENIWTKNNKNKNQNQNQNNNDGEKIKSDYFIEYLKRQIKIYKKELDVKINELELEKKIHEKKIKDINETHNVDLLNLKEKYNNEILYLKNENIENLISIKKKYERKLNNIEDDLLLDLDVLIFENHNVIDTFENYKNNEPKTRINKQLNGFYMHSDAENSFDSENFEPSGNKNGDKNGDTKIMNNNIAEVNRNIQLSIKKIKNLVLEKNKENRENNEYINNKIVNLKNIIKNNNLEKIKNYDNLEQNKKIFQQLLKYIEDIITKNEVIFSNTDNEESCLKKIKNAIYNIIKNKKYEIKNDEICKLLDKSHITRLIIHIIYFLAKEHIKTQNIKLNIIKNISLKDYTNDEINIDKKIKIFETVEKEKDNIFNSEQINIQNRDTTIIPSNEIIKYEKEIEKYEKIKNLEKKNKKLLSINEYYKKKLEHTEIWKKSIGNFKKKISHENNDSIVEPPNGQ
ncbi:hypothetical protein, partial [Plasmodium yoelii yoelii]